MSYSASTTRLRDQQTALAEFGSFAFRELDLQKILSESVRICAESLKVPFAKVCRYRAEKDDLLVVAGWGWKGDVVGNVVSKADESSTQGRAFVTGEPVILHDLAKNNSFKLPPFYESHHIVSTVDVLIKGVAGPWGVLEADSPIANIFNEHDIVFLTGFANVLAEAVSGNQRTSALQAAVKRSALLLAEKEALLEEREKRELRLRELQAEVLHISRLNAMGQMTAAIAHELNQPLAAIANYVGAAKLVLETLQEDVPSLARARSLIDKAERQTLRAGEVILKLRNLVEKRERRLAPEEIGSIIRDSLDLVLFDAADQNITVVYAIAKELPSVMADKVQIQQILINLIRNAIEAMLPAGERQLTLSAALGEPGFVHVTVRDSGPGLTKEMIEHLFQPFMTTKTAGMGLGMMICQTLVESNGGRIWRVDDGKPGAAFSFSLPLTTPHDSVLVAA